MTEKSLTRKISNPKSLFCEKDESKKQSAYSKGTVLDEQSFLEYAVFHWKFNVEISEEMLDFYS